MRHTRDRRNWEGTFARRQWPFSYFLLSGTVLSGAATRAALHRRGVAFVWFGFVAHKGWALSTAPLAVPSTRKDYIQKNMCCSKNFG